MQSHEDYCRNLTALIKDGGTWGIPRSGLVFQFFHATQTMRLVAGDAGDPDFAATREEFWKIGWRVLER